MIETKIDNGIAILTINMQDYPFNMLNADSIESLENATKAVINNDEIIGVIITSSKKDFVIGADVNLLYNMNEPESIMQATRRLQNIYRTIETSGKPFVAAINGSALGGGYELAMACHYRIAINHPKIQIGLPEIQLGLFPGAGGSQRLPRMIGIQAALPLLLEGKKVNPEKALSINLIDDIVSDAEDLIEKSLKWLKDKPVHVKPWDVKGFKIPGGGVNRPSNVMQFGGASGMIMKMTRGNFNAPKYLLSAIYEGLQVNFDKASLIEARYFTKCKLDPASNNMIRSLFWNLNAINKGANRPKGIPKNEIQKVGVLGAGMMGAGIAYSSALAGIEVILKDVSEEVLEKGKKYSEKLLQKRVERGRISEEQKNEILDRIKITLKPEDLGNCDLIVEAVPENRNIKKAVIEESEPFLADQGIMASNTSTLPITGLAEFSKIDANFIGIHFFSPVDKMKLVEVIKGEKTSDFALAKSLDYIAQLRKTPIVVNDSRGFYTTRVFKTYPYEALYMLDEGVSPAAIENLGKQAGFPVGPLAIMDELNFNLMFKILQQTENDTGQKIDNPPAQIIRKFVNEIKRFGKKDGTGFYEYPTTGKKFLWKGLAEQFPEQNHGISHADIKKRFLFIQSLEAVKCLEEGVLTSVGDGDIGSIFAWGFPPYYGGVFSYIDMIGLSEFCEQCDQLAKRFGERFKPTSGLRNMAEKGLKFHEK
jgi:3-hydroxyacyl-CoA dehydrogenase/enoyl-CoA hydratase/3-hydroxybutyryl-CoA epimerase